MFTKLLQQINISYNEKQLMLLEQYFLLLKEWNKKMNLTAIIQRDEVYQKHFFDSLLLVKHIKLDQQSLCDVGTGAGFPGIVLKIFFSDLQLFLVESSTKKCLFLNEVIKILELENVTIINERVEDITDDYYEAFDIVTIRAVARLNIILELCAGILKVKGTLIALKSNVSEEFKDAKNAMNFLGFSLKKSFESEWHFLGKRNILYFIKNKKTNKKYLRTFAQIKKSPL